MTERRNADPRVRSGLSGNLGRASPHATSSGPPEHPRAFLDVVVAASGLSKMVGRSAIERACLKAGVDPDALTRENLARVVPDIELIIRMFATPAVVEERMAAIRMLAIP